MINNGRGRPKTVNPAKYKIEVMLTADQKSLIKRAADSLGLSQSGYLAMLAMRDASSNLSWARMV